MFDDNPNALRKLPMANRHPFATLAKTTADMSGRPFAFVMAFTFIILWLATGPYFGFSDTWQLVINTSTTIITFLMVFLIQNAQNRDTRALQIKLDELIRVTEGAHSALLDLEELTDAELHVISQRYQLLAAESRRRLARGDTHVDDV
jgi:low affinity Fe/Cu permease